jgi:hypothetical protein
MNNYIDSASLLSLQDKGQAPISWQEIDGGPWFKRLRRLQKRRAAKTIGVQ